MKNGFTIIELIISIFILSLGIIGVFSAFSIVTILTSDSSDRLTATYLAQEGMEIVRNIRDTNWLNMDRANFGDPEAYSWMDGLTPAAARAPINCSNGCKADYTSTILSPYASGDYLCINTDGFYYHNDECPPSDKTKFERKITIKCYPDEYCDNATDYIMEVTSQVSWDKKATILNGFVPADTCDPSNCITAEETLYNWYNTNVSVTKVKITDPIIDSLVVDTTHKLGVEIRPDDATNKNVIWESDKPECATVDSTGLVEAHIVCLDVTVTVTAVDNGKKDEIKFDTTNQ